MDSERLELLTRIASMYFEDGMSQRQIADRTGFSRSNISRMLTEAREQRLVEIRVRHALERRDDLEQELRHRLGLTTVRVLRRDTLDDKQMLRRLGALSAQLLESLIKDGMTIGVPWGETISETIGALRPRLGTGLHVVQMVGLLGTSHANYDGSEIARRLAHSLGASYTIVPAPLFVDSESTRQALLEDHRIDRALVQTRDVNLALLGVGTLDLDKCSMLRANYLTREQVVGLRQAGAVGDVCSIFFDGEGKIVNTPLTRCVVGISAERLRAIPIRLGVAGGRAKAIPILGAARSGLINLLVTDEAAAQGIVEALERV